MGVQIAEYNPLVTGLLNDINNNNNNNNNILWDMPIHTERTIAATEARHYAKEQEG